MTPFKNKVASSKRQLPTRLQRLLLCLLTVLVLLSSGFLPAQQATNTDIYEGDIAIAWSDLSLELVRETPGFTPPVAARAFAYLGITLYETVRPGMQGYESLAGQLNNLTKLPRANVQAHFHWPSAANAAMAASMRYFFPTATSENLAAIDLLEEAFARQYIGEVDASTYSRSVIWGRSIAIAIYNWSKSDGGHEGYARNFVESFIPAVGPGLWVSTPPAYAKPLQPYWGANRPFALTAGDTCPAPDPYPYSEEPNSHFYFEALEVYLTGKELTQERREIALFWADDPGATFTPPGHWISILNQVLRRENAPLSLAAEAYAKLGIGVADAFITCWHTKYVYNVVRPITYIQEVIDPTWNTPDITDAVGTPPFPEYTSGHSVQSATAATILTALFGEDYAFVDKTHLHRGLAPRSFASFHAAAAEAAISRLYGGIHYRAAIENGLEQGHCVAEHVLALKLHH